MLFSLALMTSLGGRGWGRGQGEASALLLGHTPSGACTPAPPTPAPGPPPSSPRSSLGPLPVGHLSPPVLAPPGLVWVEEALTEEQGMQGYIL